MGYRGLHRGLGKVACSCGASCSGFQIMKAEVLFITPVSKTFVFGRKSKIRP